MKAIPAKVRIAAEETDLSRAASSTAISCGRSRRPTWSGPIPACGRSMTMRRENASAVTRDYVLEVDAGTAPPLLSVFGGKITTYRRLAEHALEKLPLFCAADGGHGLDRTRAAAGRRYA